MSILDETYTLANGVEIPRLGLGTWFIHDDDAASAVRSAVEIGYRNIDTAQAYGNEHGVGEGVRTADVPREELFVSTKLAAEIKEYDAAVEAIDGSLRGMGLEYLDLMLIHSPQPWDDFRGGDYAEGNRQAWRALEEAHAAGRIRSIGVSNFLPDDVESLLESATVVPHVNQILVHPGNTPTALLEYCASKGIVVQAYSPMGHGEVLRHPALVAMAQPYGVSVAQLCIRYTLQLGTVSLPKSGDPAHQRSNAEVDFEISGSDMDSLRDLHARDYGRATVFPVYGGR